MKHYYAERNQYGVLVSYESFGGPGRNGYEFFCFDTRDARDEWVLNNQYDKAGNIVADACTRSIVERNLGKRFAVTVSGRCFDPRFIRRW